MIALIEMAIGVVVGMAGFSRICENPTLGCCALLLAGFLAMNGFERHVCRDVVDSKAKPYSVRNR